MRFNSGHMFPDVPTYNNRSILANPVDYRIAVAEAKIANESMRLCLDFWNDSAFDFYQASLPRRSRIWHSHSIVSYVKVNLPSLSRIGCQMYLFCVLLLLMFSSADSIHWIFGKLFKRITKIYHKVYVIVTSSCRRNVRVRNKHEKCHKTTIPSRNLN